MNEHPCILTTGDFSTLTTLQEDWKDRGHALSAPLRRKLNAATVVFADDLPRDIATLGSEIAYTIGEDAMQVHTLTHLGGFDSAQLSVSTPVGLALLGRRGGAALSIEMEKGRSRRVVLHRVLQQPAPSWPGRVRPDAPVVEAPVLRLVRSAAKGRAAQNQQKPSDDDDPGPAAA